MSEIKTFRPGAVGALMDEYERAALELKKTIESISEEAYNRLMDPETADENCRSIATISSHVVSSGYSYADYLRKVFEIGSNRPPRRMLARIEVPEQMDAMLVYTIETLQEHWELSEEEIVQTKIQSGWGVSYDMEQLLEHAIVHILRHRRQIEKFLHKHPGGR
jgi:uncharacterized damage-inducible protein DinB